ncbi:MAG TPA: amidohydrolase [Gemmatimonadaceae bacterium]|jgi:imidazolonepropionase-like amidohydrolase|nr:amidohydrolase [Gemmatimonadaceae bacterium]
MRHRFVGSVAMGGVVAALGACAPAKSTAAAQQPRPAAATTPARDTTRPPPGLGGVSAPNADPFPSTYVVPASRATVIRNVTILTAAGPAIRDGSVLLRDGKIAAVGTSVSPPGDAEVIDGRGKYLTPGIIDDHSHMGVYAAPGGDALSDGNELTNPVTANVWAEHSVWPQDPQFPRALASGVTTAQILPGSGNLIGGRSVVLKMVPSPSVQGMKFPGAKYGLKMACGENPKRVYATRGPSTRMGNVAGYRAAWIQAEAYRRRWDKWNADHQGDPPQRDLGLETLAEVLRGNILVHNHCYRADEMMQMIDIAKEFGYKIRSFHHGVEAYKIADRLAKEGISASLWSDWGGFKMEAMDGVRANLAMVSAAGARAIVHSDDPSGMQRLNQDAAKAMAAGEQIGIHTTEDQAIKWLTINPAWALGLDDKIGSIEVGKNADVVLWSADPFSVYARVDRVWLDGAPAYDRANPASWWRTDFELGNVPLPTGGAR